MVKDVVSKVDRVGADPEEGKTGRRRAGQPPVLRFRPPGRRSGCSSALPDPPSRPITIVARKRASGNLPGRKARQPSAFAGLFELAIAFGKDHRPQVVEPVCRRDGSQGTVQTDVVVVLDESRAPLPEDN